MGWMRKRPGGVRVGVGMGGVRQVEDEWRFLRREQAKRPSRRHNKERRRRREGEERALSKQGPLFKVEGSGGDDAMDAENRIDVRRRGQGTAARNTGDGVKQPLPCIQMTSPAQDHLLRTYTRSLSLDQSDQHDQLGTDLKDQVGAEVSLFCWSFLDWHALCVPPQTPTLHTFSSTHSQKSMSLGDSLTRQEAVACED